MRKQKDPAKRICVRCKKRKLAVFGRDENLCCLCWLHAPNFKEKK